MYRISSNYNDVYLYEPMCTRMLATRALDHILELTLQKKHNTHKDSRPKSMIATSCNAIISCNRCIEAIRTVYGIHMTLNYYHVI